MQRTVEHANTSKDTARYAEREYLLGKTYHRECALTLILFKEAPLGARPWRFISIYFNIENTSYAILCCFCTVVLVLSDAALLLEVEQS